MDMSDLDRILEVDLKNPLDARARRLVEADYQLLDDLVALRTEKKLTQTDVAERMGISQSAVARIEAGDRDPRLSTLRRYAMAVGALIQHEVTNDELRHVRTRQGLLGSHAELTWPEPSRRIPAREAATRTAQ